MTARSVAYLLPIKSPGPPADELTNYLEIVASWCDEVVVVDASLPEIFTGAHVAWSGIVRHVPVADDIRCGNGKVRGVLTDLRLVGSDAVVIADDDVRFDAATLDDCVQRLDHAELVHPQNYFDPCPWHARWDSARTLLNRATGHDLSGASVVDVATLRRTGGYDGDVLFENLELIRTVQAAGGRVEFADDVFVRRLPPTARHFLGQRVRHAYDELARPRRLLVQLSLLPAALLLGRRGRVSLLVVGGTVAIVIMALAELGRRRCGANRHIGWCSSALAPLWVVERALCSWLAVAHRVAGGITYHGARVRRAATPVRRLRARSAIVCHG